MTDPDIHLADLAKLGGHPWGARAWIVVAAWTVVLIALARQVYRRDTGRA